MIMATISEGASHILPHSHFSIFGNLKLFSEKLDILGKSRSVTKIPCRYVAKKFTEMHSLQCSGGMFLISY